jgi:hypothetical protein
MSAENLMYPRIFKNIASPSKIIEKPIKTPPQAYSPSLYLLARYVPAIYAKSISIID